MKIPKNNNIYHYLFCTSLSSCHMRTTIIIAVSTFQQPKVLVMFCKSFGITFCNDVWFKSKSLLSNVMSFQLLLKSALCTPQLSALFLCQNDIIEKENRQSNALPPRATQIPKQKCFSPLWSSSHLYRRIIFMLNAFMHLPKQIEIQLFKIMLSQLHRSSSSVGNSSKIRICFSSATTAFALYSLQAHLSLSWLFRCTLKFNKAANAVINT